MRSNALLARADPRCVIAAVLLWSFLLALVQQMDAALAGLAGSCILICLSGLAPKPIAARMGAVNFFILFLWLFLPFSFSSPGETIAVFGPLEATREGVDLACLLTVKGNAVALGAMAFLGTSSVHRLAAAAARMGAPEKMLALFALMFRYVQVLGQEHARLRLAMRARGFRPCMSMHSYRSYANLVGMLLVRSLERAERIHAAMRCRGYCGRFWLSGDFGCTGADWLLGILMACLTGGVVSFVLF